MPKFKLSIMMLLQYMMYAVWWVPLAAYLTNLEVSSPQKALILSSMAIGCMASPLVGMLAVRFWPAQKRCWQIKSSKIRETVFGIIKD
jgi:hypothetical protein